MTKSLLPNLKRSYGTFTKDGKTVPGGLRSELRLPPEAAEALREIIGDNKGSQNAIEIVTGKQ